MGEAAIESQVNYLSQWGRCIRARGEPTSISCTRQSPGGSWGSLPTCWRCCDGVGTGIRWRRLSLAERFNSITWSVAVIPSTKDITDLVYNRAARFCPQCEILDSDISGECQVIGKQIKRRARGSIGNRAREIPENQVTQGHSTSVRRISILPVLVDIKAIEACQRPEIRKCNVGNVAWSTGVSFDESNIVTLYDADVSCFLFICEHFEVIRSGWD